MLISFAIAAVMIGYIEYHILESRPIDRCRIVAIGYLHCFLEIIWSKPSQMQVNHNLFGLLLLGGGGAEV